MSLIASLNVVLGGWVVVGKSLSCESQNIIDKIRKLKYDSNASNIAFFKNTSENKSVIGLPKLCQKLSRLDCV